MLMVATLRRTAVPGSACVALCLAISLAQGCGRPNAFHRTETAAGSPAGAGDQRLPFHQIPASVGDGARPAVPSDRQRDSATPFPSPARTRSLPAGMLITIRMDSSLSPAHVSAGDPFTASIAGPLTVDGDTLVERGTPVGGRVESAQPPEARPGLKPDPGYVRLTLNTITVDGKALVLQTSSLFASGTFQPSGSSGPRPGKSGSQVWASGFRVEKGRRLTFRLTAPVMLADPNSIANRQDPGPPSE